MAREAFSAPNADEVARVFREASGRMFKDLRFAFSQIGIAFDDAAQARIKGAYSRARPSHPDHLQSRSGGLARDGIRHEVTGSTLSTLTLRIYITKSYGRIQEFGGVVTPKRAQYLTIPLEDNLDPSGLPRSTAPEAIAAGAFFWNTPARRQSGRPGFIVRRGAPGSLEFLFVLAKRVVIPPRWGLRDEWRGGSMRQVRMEEITDALRRTLQSIKGKG